jgi:uncharacterized protein
MPLPGEHSCRLVAPVADAPTRRKNGAQKHNGKAYDVIFQEQEGKWVEQAFRYPKESWSSSEASAHCKSHDGSFTAASEAKADNSEKELRVYHVAELRVEGDKKPKIVGYAAVFNTKSEDLGGFNEYVRAGCFAKTIRESDIKALYNHDPNYVLGRNKSGTLKLEEDTTGLQMSIDPPDTQWARDLMTSIKRGDVDQCSFGFKTIRDGWRTEDGKNCRDLLECRLFDVSVVTNPAYPQTSVAVRAKVESLNSDPDEPGKNAHSEAEPEKNLHSHEQERKRQQKVLLEIEEVDMKRRLNG